jgi:hypothetical protein
MDYEFKSPAHNALNKGLRALQEGADVLNRVNDFLPYVSAESVVFRPKASASSLGRAKSREVAQLESGADLRQIACDASSGGLVSEWRADEPGIPGQLFCVRSWPHGVVFDEPSHKYNVVGHVFRGSATGIVHSPFEHFDEKAVSLRLTGSTRGRYAGMTQQEILDDWEEARQLGTLFHLFVEMYFNDICLSSVPVQQLGTEYSYFQQFREVEMKRRGWEIVMTEVILYDWESETCGMIDAIAREKTPAGWKYILLDWKRTRTMSFEAFKKKMGKWPCDGIQDCNGGHYTLQLNLYKFILKKRRDKDIAGMFLARFHPDAPSYEIYPIPDAQQEIRKLLRMRRYNLYRLDIVYWEKQLRRYLAWDGSPRSAAAADPGAQTKRRCPGASSPCGTWFREEIWTPLLNAWVRLAYRLSREHFMCCSHPTTTPRPASPLLLDLPLDPSPAPSAPSLQPAAPLRPPVPPACEKEAAAPAPGCVNFLEGLVSETHRAFLLANRQLLSPRSPHEKELAPPAVLESLGKVSRALHRWQQVLSAEGLSEKIKNPLFVFSRGKNIFHCSASPLHRQQGLQKTPRSAPGATPSPLERPIAEYFSLVAQKPELATTGLCYTHEPDFPQNHTTLVAKMTPPQLQWHLLNIIHEKLGQDSTTKKKINMATN